MNALVGVAVPAITDCAFPESFLIQCAIIERKIMLTGNVEYLSCLRTLNHLPSRIELRGLRVLSDVASMNHEVWQLRPCGDRIDPVDGLLQRPRHIRISALVESNVTIADLDEGEVLCLPNPAVTALCCQRQQPGCRNSARHRPQQS